MKKWFLFLAVLVLICPLARARLRAEGEVFQTQCHIVIKDLDHKATIWECLGAGYIKTDDPRFFYFDPAKDYTLTLKQTKLGKVLIYKEKTK